MSLTNMRNICRACLVSSETFEHALLKSVSADVYWFCTSVIILEDDLPKTICNSCYEHLTKFSKFKQTCIQSQNTLLEYYEKIDTKILKTEQTMQDLQNNSINENKYKLNMPINVKLEEFTHCDDDIGYENVFCNKSIPETKSTKKTVVENNVKMREKPKICFKCDLCNKKFSYRTTFEAHKMVHEGKSVSIRCEICNKTFLTWGNLKRHNDSLHTIINLKSLQCNTCGRICKSKSSLQLHEKGHNVKRLLVCDICGISVTNENILKAHLQIHNELRERLFTCEQCGKKFYTHRMLSTHMSRVHTGKRFICHECDFPFTDKYNLVKHLLKHEGKKLYKCNICEKSFAAHSTLVEHKRIHSGERPYGCGFCPKRFLSKRRVDEHVLIHTGERPHKCSSCGHGFTQRGSLKRHMKIHNRFKM